MCLHAMASVLIWVAVQTKALLLAVVCAVLTGCAHYDVSFNKPQVYLDEYRHIRGSVEQGRLP
jgi:hypothetical protein